MENKYIIYGAGKQGQAYYSFLKQRGLGSSVIGFCDRRFHEIGTIADKQVLGYDTAKKYNACFVIAIGDEETGKDIRKMLGADNQKYCSIDDFAREIQMSRVEFNRELCALFHEDSMEEYFINAESDDSVGVFWGDGSVFRRMFLKLNLENVIELACGRGRHVPQYLSSAGHITLVDILSKNIAFCQVRFKEQSNITYYQNDGYTLSALASSTYTALFSYDAMVHFEMMDIYEYLVDIYRVLIPGGKVLLHHSNNDKNYKASFNNTKHGRSFMNKDIFAYLAYRAGFEVVEQDVIDWDGYRGIDCITLLEKPAR